MQPESRNLPWLLWLFWTLAGIGLLFLVAQDEGAQLSTNTWASLILGMAPLIGAQLTLGSPPAAQKTRAWLRTVNQPLKHTAAGIALLYLLSGLLVGGFNPYTFTIFTVGVFAALGTLRQIERGVSGLTWADAAVWLLLWIPFDLRWNYDLWTGPDGFAYHWWSVALSVIAVIGWYGLRELPEFGYNLVPTWRDIGITLPAFLGFFVIVVPIALGIGFITFPPTTKFTFLALLANFAGTFLTIGIPEELFFRGVLLHGLDQKYKDKPWLPLLLSSLAFGLMHWNNVSSLEEKIAYVALASLAGAFYGWAYRRSGNKLFSAVLLHTLVDVVWVFVFR